MADLRHALRLYLKTPASSAIAVVTLGAALAAVTAFLTLWNDLSLRPHPGFEDGGELITIGQNDGQRFFSIALELMLRIEEDATSVQSIAGLFDMTLEMDRDGERERVRAELVTERYFPGLRPRIQLGRPLDDRDHTDDADPAAILSHDFWQREYGGQPDALGQTLRLYGLEPTRDATEVLLEHRIVGVMVPEHTGTFRTDTDVWFPHAQAMAALSGEERDRQSMFVETLARLAPGASAESARSELQGRFPMGFEDRGFRIGPIDTIGGVVDDLNTHRDALRQVRLFLGGSVLLALVAACNVSLFLLSRAPGRRRELAIRRAVGAPLKRLARQLVTESGVLVVAASAFGVFASLWLAVVASELAFLRQARWRDIAVFDGRVLLLLLAFVSVLTLLVALAPIVGLKRLEIGEASRSVTARAGWGQRLTGTAQLALASVIGAAAIAFIWHLGAMSNVDKGFSAPDVYAVRPIPTNPRAFNVDASEFPVRERRREVVSAYPGVESVAFATGAPGIAVLLFLRQAVPPDDPDAIMRYDQYLVDAAYFDVLGFSLLDGRFPDDSSRGDVVVNETMARQLWGRTDVVGELVPYVFRGNTPPPRNEVVGVIGDVTFGHPSNDVQPMAFAVGSGQASSELILVKTEAPLADIQRMVQQSIDDGALEFEIGEIRRLEDAWGEVLAPDRARATVTVTSAILVLVLAAFGYFGIQRFLVASGRREYAILSALGAGPRAIGGLVFSRSIRQGLPGVVLGCLLAVIAVAWMQDGFISAEVSPVLIAVLVGIGVIALLLGATLGPARQARATDPAPLLKEE